MMTIMLTLSPVTPLLALALCCVIPSTWATGAAYTFGTLQPLNSSQALLIDLQKGVGLIAGLQAAFLEANLSTTNLTPTT